MKIFFIKKSPQIHFWLFLFSKHLDMMANMTDYDYSKTNFWWWRWLFWSQKDYLLSQVKFKLKMCTKRSTYCATQEFFFWQFLHLKYALLFLKSPPLYLKKYITTSIILNIYLVYFLLRLCWPSKFSNT